MDSRGLSLSRDWRWLCPLVRPVCNLHSGDPPYALLPSPCSAYAPSISAIEPSPYRSWLSSRPQSQPGSHFRRLAKGCVGRQYIVLLLIKTLDSFRLGTSTKLLGSGSGPGTALVQESARRCQKSPKKARPLHVSASPRTRPSSLNSANGVAFPLSQCPLCKCNTSPVSGRNKET
jgi:hypothetical protein